MMDPALKAALGLCVVLVGVCAAMLFRHDRPRPASPATDVEEETLLRWRVESASPRGLVRQSTGGARPATVVTPLDRRESPPSLAPNYPAADRPASSQWGVPMEMMLPMAPPANETARTHTVVDGDTLASLAEHYLGSAARAQEIFQANRNLLSDPDLLPIGAELKLPSSKRP